MKEHIPLKYECLDRFQDIVKNCADNNAAKLLIEMFDLIRYQMKQIQDQRMEIIGLKHKEAWKHYDRPLDQYDSEQRKYIDKPPKSGNMSC
jgi:hypothetical protein